MNCLAKSKILVMHKQLQGPFVIDWQWASLGHPAADIAYTKVYTMLAIPTAPNLAFKMFASIFILPMTRLYEKSYLKIKPIPRELIRKYMPIRAAILMMGPRTDAQRNYLEKLVKKYL